MCTEPSTIGLCALFLMHLRKRRNSRRTFLAPLNGSLKENLVTVRLSCFCNGLTCLSGHVRPLYHLLRSKQTLRPSFLFSLSLSMANYLLKGTLLLFVNEMSKQKRIVTLPLLSTSCGFNRYLTSLSDDKLIYCIFLPVSQQEVHQSCSIFGEEIVNSMCLFVVGR